MLKCACLLAKIGADTAENERNFAEILPKIGNYPTGPSWMLPVTTLAQLVPLLPRPAVDVFLAVGTWASRFRSFSLPPDTPGEGPLTATKTSAPRRGRTIGRRWVSGRVSGRVLSRHPLKFMEICK